MPADAASANWHDRARHWAKAAPAGASASNAAEINRNLIACAQIMAGDHVLDLASGTGEPSITMAQLVGEDGSVTATDATQAMLDVAEARAAKLWLTNMRFQVTPMEEIPFTDNRFDAVTCRFGLMHATDAVAGLRQARRVVKDGGRAAFAVHGSEAPDNLWWLVQNAAKEFFGDESDIRTSRHNRFSGEGETGALFERAGFTDIEEKTFVVQSRHPAGGDGGGPEFWRPMVQRGFAHLFAELDAASLAELDKRLGVAFAPFQIGDEYVLSASQRITSGVK
jgi:ubiquinone/menaquinone biosynthesis C-methylase UbiE